jgi:DNA mismatch repair ATPase MutL
MYVIVEVLLIKARKHHTSKLTSFENLEDLQTFGFRGEALSSLCALSDIQIVTATREEVPRATTLDFNHLGEIISRKVSSANVLLHLQVNGSVVLPCLLVIYFQRFLFDEKNCQRIVNGSLQRR